MISTKKVTRKNKKQKTGIEGKKEIKISMQISLLASGKGRGEP